MNFKELCQELEKTIESAYTEGVALEQAERLAARFLQAQMIVSRELQKSSLDYRMRKSGLKAVKSAIYLEEATKTDKKPSDVMLNALVDSNTVVQGEQENLDIAETSKEELERYYDVFLNAHIYFRSLMKGQFGGN